MSEDGEEMRRLTISVHAPLFRAIEAGVDSARERSDLPDLSKAEMFRYLADTGLDHWDRSIEALIPDAKIESYRVVRQREIIKQETYLDDLAGGWRGRVKSALNARLAGEEPYAAKWIHRLARGYEREARLYFEGEELADHLRWLDDRLECYIEGYQAKQSVPDRLFSEIGEVALGRDLWRLRRDPVVVIETIEEIGDSCAYDPDAMIERISSEFGVDTEAVELILDAMTEADIDERQALKTGEFRDFLPDRALEAPDVSSDLDSRRVDRGEGSSYDDATGSLVLEVDGGIDDDPAPEIDPDALREEIRGDD